jgi:NADH:ubiquinone oxidoreductase subunit K
MSELGPIIWATVPLFVIGLYGLVARRNLVRIMISLEIVGAATVTIMGASAVALWNSMGEVLGLLALIAIGIEGALLIATATLMTRTVGTFDIIVFKKEKRGEIE